MCTRAIRSGIQGCIGPTLEQADEGASTGARSRWDERCTYETALVQSLDSKAWRGATLILTA